jgi:hypothetical protein
VLVVLARTRGRRLAEIMYLRSGKRQAARPRRRSCAELMTSGQE